MITCTLNSVDLAPTAIDGQDFGTLGCSPPFGPGVQHNLNHLSPTSPTTGTVDGVAQLFLATGTLRAAFSLAYTISGEAIAYKGTARITGGTGTYDGATGAAKLTGSSPDGGTHSTFTELIVARIAD